MVITFRHFSDVLIKMLKCEYKNIDEIKFRANKSGKIEKTWYNRHRFDDSLAIYCTAKQTYCVKV